MNDSDWANRRKLIYTGIILAILIAVASLSFYKFWYRAPLCTDKLQNGDETGVDCGGSCSLVCSAQALAPVIRSDPRMFQIYPGVYSVVAFVENHNIDSSAANVSYKFTFYDSSGGVVGERVGATSLLRNKNSFIFEGNINLGTTTPSRATFQLSPNIIWTKDKSELPEINIEHSAILNGATAPKIEAVVKNDSLMDVNNLEITAVIFDGKETPLAASETFINLLRKGEKAPVFFTWPKPFPVGESACAIPSETLLLLDRSGSMTSISQNPPEPLNSVKAAAKSFLSELKGGDRAGLISFATEASPVPDSALSEDLSLVTWAIDNISIATGTLQYTNISDVLDKAVQEFANNSESNENKVIILLTDGVANRPADPKSKLEKDNIIFAEKDALDKASLARENNISVFTIGLGKDIHADFLKQVASSSAEYFSAPTSSDLNKIYSQISSSICEEVPARIELDYRIIN